MTYEMNRASYCDDNYANQGKEQMSSQVNRNTLTHYKSNVYSEEHPNESRLHQRTSDMSDSRTITDNGNYIAFDHLFWF